MSEGGWERLPSDLRVDNDGLIELESFFAQVFADSRALKTLIRQSGLPPAAVDPDGEIVDRWSEVVRACNEREGCLAKLIESAQRRLSGTEGGKKLGQLVTSALQRQASEQRGRAGAAIAAVRDKIERLRDLEDPAQSAGLSREIRTEVRTLWRLLEADTTGTDLMAGVGIVAESSRETRQGLVLACMELVSAVDRLLGRIRLVGESTGTTGPLLRDIHEDVLQSTYRLDAVIDARDLLIRRAVRFLDLVDQQLPLTRRRSSS